MQVIQDTFKGCFVKGSGQGPTLHGVYSNQFHTVLIVNGEEDLLVLPVLVEALLGSVLYYGQPNDGVVRVKISQKKKQLGRILMRKFVNQA